jgi:hypothetical protein
MAVYEHFYRAYEGEAWSSRVSACAKFLSQSF